MATDGKKPNKTVGSRTKQAAISFINKARKYTNRGTAANLMMISFILFTAIGCFQIYAPAGFISAGIGCGLFGFLLGQE
jgi:hypothetical protein